ncbi:MAG: GC-type dockerin domain-anchored protein [Phycisphaerales bacterium]
MFDQSGTLPWRGAVMKFADNQWAFVGSTFSDGPSVGLSPQGELTAWGSFFNAGPDGATGVASFVGGDWRPVVPGSQAASTFAVAWGPDNRVLIGGDFIGVNNSVAFHVAERVGATSEWHGFGEQRPSVYGEVFAVKQTPLGVLIGGGVATYDSGAWNSGIARWDNGRLLPLGTGLVSTVRAILPLADGRVAAAGSISGGTAANRLRGVHVWNGTAWSQLGGDFGPAGSEIDSLAQLPNGDIVAGGRFSTAGGVQVNSIARWNGTAWSPLASGFSGANVYALAVLPNGDLVAGGSFFSSGSTQVSRIARWNGTAWTAMGQGLDSEVRALLVRANGDLIASGRFTHSGVAQARYMARWTGSTWVEFAGGASSFVKGLAETETGGVLAAGWFTSAGTTPANRVALWDGSAWHAYGSGLDETNAWAVASLGGGEVLVGGNFTFAGGRPSIGLAHWGVPQPTTAAAAAPVLVCAGSDAELNVTAGGSGPFTVRWLRGGQPIVASERFSGVDSASLVVHSATHGDSGVYSAEVTGVCGTAAAEATLLVSPADLGSAGGVSSPDGAYDNNDFIAFIGLFFAGDAAADLGRTGGEFGPDGLFNNNDFIVFINRFFEGC